MIVDGESGLMLPPRDECTLAAAMSRVLADSELSSRLGQNAQKRVRAFTASVVASQLESVYKRVVPQASEEATAVTKASR
jgi:glycosyltransferase involved in cell wall biosynthesis